MKVSAILPMASVGVTRNGVPDFPILGQKYGKDIERITTYLKSINCQELVEKVKKMNSVIITGKDGDIEILPEELILEAAENCPVAAITVTDADTGEQLFP